MESDSAQNRKGIPSNVFNKLPETINVGTRKSELALIQTRQVIGKLENFYLNNPDRLAALCNSNGEGDTCKQDVKFREVAMSTQGDEILDKPLPEIGSKSLFTAALELALLDGSVHMIVHSLKDLPTTLPEGCVIGAVMERDDPNDVIVLKRSLRGRVDPYDLLLGSNDDERENSDQVKIGTSSQRRKAMIHRCSRKSQCIDIRGNLNTRLAKLDNENNEYAAIILARAGLDRMGWSDRASGMLGPQIRPELSEWSYAVGQGAIAIECLASDSTMLKLLEPIAHLETTYEVVAERSLMRKLEGGCSVPLGVRCLWSNDNTVLTLTAIVLSLDGQKTVEASGSVEVNKDATGEQSTSFVGLLDTEEATGIVIPLCCSLGDRHNFAKCANLGVDVANKMINLGCLDLMRP